MKPLLLLLLLPLSAVAQVTYQYVGVPLGGASSPAYLVTGNVVLAQALAANGTQTVTPVNYSFVGNLPLATQNGEAYPNAPSPPSFTFTTENGVITGWDVEIDVTTGNTVATLSVTSSGDSYELEVETNACQTGHNLEECFDTVSSNSAAGSWSIPQAQVAPAMAAMTASRAYQDLSVTMSVLRGIGAIR